jgi:HYR domain
LIVHIVSVFGPLINSYHCFSYTYTADRTAPVVAATADKSIEAVDAQGAALTFTVSTTDAVDGVSNAACVITGTTTTASGYKFPIGTTQVTCTKTDAAGNVATPIMFNVVVGKHQSHLHYLTDVRFCLSDTHMHMHEHCCSEL